jgi:3-methyladenine DNA glycosylase Tag
VTTGIAEWRICPREEAPVAAAHHRVGPSFRNLFQKTLLAHDEEWGVPVHDDRKLFELLTLSQALAELSWPFILSKREEFSAMIDGFYSASLCEFTDKKMNQLSKSNGSTLLSEQKMRAVITNYKQIRKVN